MSFTDSDGSVWLRPHRPPRDRQLSRDRIVSVAVSVLDADGHRGLSMRRVAAELGVTAGSLYWYVRTKDDLLELALDRVLGEVRTDPAETDWRRGLAGLARGNREMLLRHRWALMELTVRPNLGPNAFALTESGLRLLARAGFADSDLDAVMSAVNDHVVGAVISQVSWVNSLERMSEAGIGVRVRERAGARTQAGTGPQTGAASEAGTGAGSGDSWSEYAATTYLRDVADRHPMLARRMAATREIDVERECERRFEFALNCLLEGLAASHDASGATSVADPGRDV